MPKKEQNGKKCNVCPQRREGQLTYEEENNGPGNQFPVSGETYSFVVIYLQKSLIYMYKTRENGPY